MPFPFYWIGAIVASVVLLVTLSLFGAALRAIDRAVMGVRGSILPGLVEGFRDWTDDLRPARRRRTVSPSGPETGDGIEDAPSSAAPPAERLRPHLR